MTVISFGNTAIVIDRVVAIQCDEPFSGDEAVRDYLAGITHPVELSVEDPGEGLPRDLFCHLQVANAKDQMGVLFGRSADARRGKGGEPR